MHLLPRPPTPQPPTTQPLTTQPPTTQPPTPQPETPRHPTPQHSTPPAQKFKIISSPSARIQVTTTTTATINVAASDTTIRSSVTGQVTSPGNTVIANSTIPQMGPTSTSNSGLNTIMSSSSSSIPDPTATSSLTNGTPSTANAQTQHGLQKHSIIAIALAIPLILICLGSITLYTRRRQRRREIKESETRIPRVMDDGDNGGGGTSRDVKQRQWLLTTSYSTDDLMVRLYNVSDKLERVDTPSEHKLFQHQGANTTNSSVHQHMALVRNASTITHIFSQRSSASAVATAGSMTSTYIDTLPSISVDTQINSEVPPAPRQPTFSRSPGGATPPGGDVLGTLANPIASYNANYNPDRLPAPEPVVLPISGNEDEVAASATATTVSPQTVLISVFELDELRERIRAMEDADMDPPPDYYNSGFSGASGEKSWTQDGR